SSFHKYRLRPDPTNTLAANRLPYRKTFAETITMKGQPTVGSLFTGIGGLDLGFIQEGFRIEWMCERDEFCKKILTKHWPEVPIYDDITELHDPPKVDVLVGGFPCQDISKAGKNRKGLDGKRSGLWW